MKHMYLLLTLLAPLASRSLSAIPVTKVLTLEEEVQHIEQELAQTEQKLRDVARRGADLKQHYEDGMRNGLLLLKKDEIKLLIEEEDALLDKKARLIEKLKDKPRLSSIQKIIRFGINVGIPAAAILITARFLWRNR